MSDVNVDPSVLHERNESYSSLTDIYGIDLFTKEFEEKVENYGKKQKESYERVEEEVFVTEMEEEDDQYDQVQALLFLDDNRIVKETSEEEKSDLRMAIPFIGMICVITVVLLLQYIDKRRRKWRQDEADVDVYE